MTTETITLELLVHKISSLETQVRVIGAEVAVLKSEQMRSLYADKSELRHYFLQAFPNRVEPEERWGIEQLQKELGSKLKSNELSQDIIHMREE